jgi:hypothetical protein
VARESDERRLAALRAIFADTATNVPAFTNTAMTGGHRRDEGLRNLLPAELTDYEKRCALKRAIVAALENGQAPTVERRSGDAEMQLEAALFCHFRVVVAEVLLFVKVFADECGNELVVRVISVKRDDQAWK